MDLSALTTAIASVQRLDGVAGSFLFKGRNAIHKQMPFSDGRTLDLMDVLGEMLDGYRQVRRKIRQVYLEFDGGVLLILVQDTSALVFFLTGRADADLVASAGTVLLKDFAVFLAGVSDQVSTAPAQIEELIVTTPRAAQQMATKQEAQLNTWGPLRKQVEALLGKVMGRAQVVAMIDRQLVKLGIDDPYRMPASGLRNLATALIEVVPNTSKRAALLSELETVLQEHHL
jgi:hypothetical protein